MDLELMRSKTLSRIDALSNSLDVALRVTEYETIGRLVPWKSHLNFFKERFNDAFTSEGFIAEIGSPVYFYAFRIYLGSSAIVTSNFPYIFSKGLNPSPISKFVENLYENFASKPEQQAFLKSDEIIFNRNYIIEQLEKATEDQKDVILEIACNFLNNPEKTGQAYLPKRKSTSLIKKGLEF